jgi:hypothetical protein
MDYETVSNEALLRMREALMAGKGVRLTLEELQALNLTMIGQWWSVLSEAHQPNEQEQR